MQKNSKWHNGRFGPVCNGRGRYRLTEEFFQWVCIENGFERVDFFGNKKSYFDYIESTYGSKVHSYFRSLYRHDKNVPSYTVGGAMMSDGKWKIVDYDYSGGNCLEWKSSVFVHCSGGGWKEEYLLTSWKQVSYCNGCNSVQYHIQNCQEKEVNFHSNKCPRENALVTYSPCECFNDAYGLAYNDYYYEYSSSNDYGSYRKKREANLAPKYIPIEETTWNKKKYCPCQFQNRCNVNRQGNKCTKQLLTSTMDPTTPTIEISTEPTTTTSITSTTTTSTTTRSTTTTTTTSTTRQPIQNKLETNRPLIEPNSLSTLDMLLISLEKLFS